MLTLSLGFSVGQGSFLDLDASGLKNELEGKGLAGLYLSHISYISLDTFSVGDALPTLIR